MELGLFLLTDTFVVLFKSLPMLLMLPPMLHHRSDSSRPKADFCILLLSQRPLFHPLVLVLKDNVQRFLTPLEIMLKYEATVPTATVDTTLYATYFDITQHSWLPHH